jgi:peptidoglycan/LPS O-acetylase OafA/YrhL
MQYKLESLRGIAACMVVLYHSPFNININRLPFMEHGYLFVDFFFVLSGFVMALAYGEKIKNHMKFKSYMFLRLGRLYPLHLFMLLTYIPYILARQWFFLKGLGGEDQFIDNNIYSFAGNLVLVHSMGLFDSLSWNSPSWSISTEVFAYMVFFLFTVTIDKKEWLYAPLLISLVFYGYLVSLNKPSLDLTFDYGFFRCVGAFYLGVFVFRLRKFTDVMSIISRNVAFWEALAVAFIVVGVTIAEANRLFFVFPILAFALTVLVFSSGTDGVFGRLLNVTALRRVGLWSYSVYMVHRLICGVMGNVGKYVWGFDATAAIGLVAIPLNILVLLMTITVSRFTYKYIEEKYRDITKARIKAASTAAPHAG